MEASRTMPGAATGSCIILCKLFSFLHFPRLSNVKFPHRVNVMVKVVCAGAREIVKCMETFTALEEDLALFPASTQ